ncbi:MAG: fimbrillin family protein [Bacteroidales bacterium]|nr:fimbrillin family protein [Bacteroidales bacterium]
MKKHLLIFAALVATMTGCVKNEVMDVSDSGEISFDTYVGKHTRAVVINGRTDLSRFYVYGNMTNADGTGQEQVFDSEDVVWTGTSAQNGHYEYNGGVSKMWEADKKYYFAAVSNGNAAFKSEDVIGTEVFNSTNVVDFSYVYPGTGDNQITINDYTVTDKDLIVDIADPIETGESMVGNETVTFDFRHILTRVRFVINNGDAVGSNQIVAVQDLKFSGAKKGDCTYKLTAPNTHTITWDDFGTAAEYVYTADRVDPAANEEYVITPSSNKSFGHFVIPQSNDDKNVTFTLVTYHREGTQENYTYTRTNSQEYTFSLKYDNGNNDYNWHPGKVYQYTVTLVGTTSYIHFDANVASWNFDINGDGSSNSVDDIPMTNN